MHERHTQATECAVFSCLSVAPIRMEPSDWYLIIPAIVAALALGAVFLIIMVVQARQYATFVGLLQNQLENCLQRWADHQEELYGYREQLGKTNKALEEFQTSDWIKSGRLKDQDQRIAELERENAELRAQLAGRQLTRRDDDE